ncbi:MAG: metal-dependent transcriptional regulator [Oscillospiraceae bacterium]|nr:metal-dependent transcriptional regulator [Oscillospiraceae bacterium]
MIAEINMTASLEDYLEAVLVLSQSNSEVRLTDIAAMLNVSKPSANRAVNTLKQNGFLSHETYGAITLTPEGETYAASVLHRHKLLKHFLNDTLGVSEKTAEEDACKMEHVMSAETIEKLYDYLERQ